MTRIGPRTATLTVANLKSVMRRYLERLRRHRDEHRPGAELEVVDGGQPLYPYLISVE